MTATVIDQARPGAMPSAGMLAAIAREASAAFADRAAFARSDWRDWSDIELWRAYVACLESGRAWHCPRLGRVVATVDGPAWHYVAAEVLDVACDRAGLWHLADWPAARIDGYGPVSVLRFT